MAHKLKIVDGQLDKGIASLTAAHGFFESVKDQAGESARACGHSRLANALLDSSTTWALRRDKLSEDLGNLTQHLKNTQATFGNVEREFANQMSQDPSPSTDQGSTAGAGSGGGGGGSGASPLQPLPAESGKQALIDPALDEGPRQAPPIPAPETGADEPSDGPVVTPPEDIDTPNMPPAPQPDAAAIQRLVGDLIGQWVALGGTPETFFKAITASGVGALLIAALARGRTGNGRGQGLRLEDLFPDAWPKGEGGHATPGHGSTAPVDGGDGDPIVPSDLVPSDRDGLVSIDSDAGVEGLESQPGEGAAVEVDAGPPMVGLAEAELPADAAVPAEGPLAAGPTGAPFGGPDAAGGLSANPAGLDLSALQADAVIGGVDGGGVPVHLPDLTADLVNQPSSNPVQPLPPLAAENLTDVAPAVATAGAAPLLAGASGLHSPASTGAGHAGGAPMPSLATSSPSSTAGSERSAPGQRAQEAERILEDLRADKEVGS